LGVKRRVQERRNRKTLIEQQAAALLLGDADAIEARKTAAVNIGRAPPVVGRARAGARKGGQHRWLEALGGGTVADLPRRVVSPAVGPALGCEGATEGVAGAHTDDVVAERGTGYRRGHRVPRRRPVAELSVAVATPASDLVATAKHARVVFSGG